MLLACAGCRPSPSEVVESALRAAEQGRFDDFASHFTHRSRAVLEGFHSLGEHGLGAFAFGALPAGASIVGERMLPGDPAIRAGSVPIAIVEVRAGELVLPFPLVEERGRWRIHLASMADRWYRFGTGPFAAGSLPDLPGEVIEVPRVDRPDEPALE